MKTIKLFRGESVKETDVELRINEIKQNGFSKSPHRTNIQKDLKPFLNQLYAQENLSSEQTQCKSIWVEKKMEAIASILKGLKQLILVIILVLNFTHIDRVLAASISFH